MPRRRRDRPSRLTGAVALVAVVALVGGDAAGALEHHEALPPNLAIATNTVDGTRSVATSFALHQVEVAPDGLVVTTDADVGPGRRHELPARGRRADDAGPGGSAALAEWVLDPAQVRAALEESLARLLEEAGMDPVVGLPLSNLALAFNSCRDCRSVASAAQVVLVSGVPTPPLVATNVAQAVNVDCVGCEAGAHAFQLVIATSGPLPLDRPTLAAIARTRSRLARIAHGGEPVAVVVDELRRETDRLGAALVGPLTGRMR
jgi:hypothetical protein